MKAPFLLHLIIIYTILTLSAPLSAQESFTDRYNITYLTMNDGLPHNFVDDIYKDSYGFIWIAMGGGGLSRYDGYEFQNFTPSGGNCKLKSNFIRNVYEDGFQRLWAVSEGGTDIIDLKTLQSVIPYDATGALTKLINQPATHVIQDSQGYIWLHCGNRLHRIAFDRQGNIREIKTFSHPGLERNDIIFRDVDEDGKIWIGLNSKLYKIGTDSKGRLRETLVSDRLIFPSGTFFTDYIAKENEIWIATNEGLFRYNKNENIMKHYTHVADNPNTLSQNFLTDLAITDEKQLMIASLKGINIYNPIKDNFEQIGDRLSNIGTGMLNSNFINCIFMEGRHIWIGTESGGINKLTYKRLYIQNYQHDKDNPRTLSGNPVNAIYEDADGSLWVGTVEGGLNKKEPGADTFTHYTYESGILSHNSVSAITADPQGELWVGTWGGGITLLDRKHPNRVVQRITSESANNITVDFIGALIYDPINNGMWIGSNQGLFFYDLEQRKILSPLANNVARTIRGCIGSVIDQSGHLWVGCLDGVYIIDLHSRDRKQADGFFTHRHLKYKLDQPESKLIEKICCFHEAKDGSLWLGSNGYGIYRRTVDKAGKEHFISYSSGQGLSNNCVRSILEDEKGYIWVATNNGLFRFQPSKNHFTNYTRQDGLSDTQFYWNAACRSRENKLYFGNVAGLVGIECNYPTVPLQSSQIRFTKLKVGNREILPQAGEILSQDISVAKEVRIHEREKSFSIEFSALNFEQDNAATYSYRLLGFESKWIQVAGNRRFASYTNLSPGEYLLQVKYSSDNENGEKTEQMAELNIIILPYFYKTVWFILLSILFLAFIVWQFYQWRIRSLKQQKKTLHQTVEQRTYELKEQKQLLEKQTEELSRQNHMLKQQNEKITRQKIQLTKMTRKIQELTMDKIAFFTNITHEFRTPITLIIGPIERALKLSYNPQVIEQLHFVERNSKYLLSLINQLMDFRKVESGKLEIVRSKNNFLRFINELITPFQSFARERNIRIKCYFRVSDPEMMFDEEAMHKVFTNLLSNAIKFTPNGGYVSLYVARLSKRQAGEEKLYICISDTGTGIPEEDITKIFNRFYQSQNQMKYPIYGQAGSGIGLYLCKRIVQMLGGIITARNNRTAGCSLRILLPLPKEEDCVKNAESRKGIPTSESGEVLLPTNRREEITILVVEDNDDMRSYIRSILQEKYKVMEAPDGVEALKILYSQNIDFIISDLMMPNMDGIELSRKVKENIAISHIPFLMLTAKTSPSVRIESYRIGVDEYLLKPFDETLLLTRIENILENRKRYQRKFATSMNIDALNIDEESSDKKFINKVMEVVKAHYKDSYFEVTDFCEAVGVSKTLLNQKLQSIVGQSAGQFIRNYRLNLARDLIIKSKSTKNKNIAEIAYDVGFNDPKYFTRCFIKLYNIKPSDLLNEE